MVSAQGVKLLVGRQGLAVVFEQEVHVAELAVDLGVDVAGLDWVSPVVIVVLKKQNIESFMAFYCEKQLQHSYRKLHNQPSLKKFFIKCHFYKTCYVEWMIKFATC